MKTVHVVMLLLALLGAGCANRNATVLLERDLRLQEDEIYRLRCMVDQCDAAHQATLRENEALKKELATGDAGAGGTYREPAVSLPPAEGPSRSRTRQEPPRLEAPTIELPEGSDLPDGSMAPEVEVTPGTEDGAALDGTPTQLVINKQLTGGLDRDGHDGDEGLLVVVEPRDAENQLIKAVGPVSIVVMDPAQPGEASRVARWDFAAHEVQSRFHNTMFGKGMQFELPWPGAPPQHADLRLYVRFTTDDGARLNAETPIAIRPPVAQFHGDRQTRTWSPSPEGDDSGRAPTSRLKSSPGRSSPSRALRQRHERDAADARASDEGEPVEQATRPGWKPYR